MTPAKPSPTRIPCKKTLISSVLSTLLISGSAFANTIWQEDFNAAELDRKGATGVGRIDGQVLPADIDTDGVTRWSIDISSAELSASSDWFRVQNGVFEARDVDGPAVWTSEVIDISNVNNVDVTLVASEQGTHESSGSGFDFFDFAYSIDNQPFVTVTNVEGLGDASHSLVGDFTQATIRQSLSEGSSLVLRVTMQNGAGSEFLRLDNVVVAEGDGSSSGNNGSDGDSGAGSSGGDTGSGGSDNGGDSGSGTNNGDTISNACLNCADLTKIADQAQFVDSTYYASALTAVQSGDSADNVRFAINNIISQGHQQLTYSQVWTALTQTDEDPADTSKVVLIYKGNSIAKTSNGSAEQASNPDNWNREHVWASSHGFSDRSALAFTDIHHLRPADISVNGARGNLDFDESDNALAEAPANSIDSDSFEPRDAVKGDVARMMFYMDVRYAGNDSITPDLVLVDQLTSSGEPRLGKLCTLLAWHQADPVDDFERRRNNRAYEFQGNRNPFVDHPEWVDTVFTQNCSDSGNTGGGDSGNGGDNGGDNGAGNGGDNGSGNGSNQGELFFSEYVEGSGSNKAVEIFNPTDRTIALSDYQFKLYSNGNTNATSSYQFTGDIAPKGTVVLVTSSSRASDELKAKADQFSGAVNFNGDDYIELTKGDTIVDGVGVYGNRTNWGANVTFVRKPTIAQGDNDRTDAFDAAVEWNRQSSDDFSFLGAHEFTGPVTTPPPSLIGECADSATLISAIQGNGDTSPLAGENHVIEGVVTSVVPSLSGFFIQEEAADQDNDSQTSEAIFVFLNGQSMPQVGQQVRAIGDVSERFNRTQFALTEAVKACGNGEIISAVDVNLPVANLADLEAVEGMLVNLPQTLSVADNFNLARFGQVTLSNGRLYNPTSVYAPGSSRATALADRNARNKIVLDDQNNQQNPENIPFPTGGLSYNNTLRLGDQVDNLTGVVDFSFGDYRILPTSTPVFTSANPRTAAPENVAGGNLKVASFNVLNYFNGDGNGAGFPTPRGADSQVEFDRQSTKIVNAIAAIDADVVGLMEIENDGFGASSAIADLVNRLNTQMGDNTYAFVNSDTVLGGDAISVGMIYKPAVVELVGDSATLTSVPFDFGNRPPLAQSFKLLANDEELTVVVNHFRAKRCSSSSTGDNVDQGDGQGCNNATRTAAANATLTWLATNPVGSNDSDVLLVGDMNAYAQEDPIQAFVGNGYQNLIAKYAGRTAYSFSFGGEVGYLDHALASESLSTQVLGASVWNINADEPRAFDYNVEFKSGAQLVNYYGDDAYRASDHDPVVVTIDLASAEETVRGDFDNDKDVDRDDIRAFARAFRAGLLTDLIHDYNGDGVINRRDSRALRQLCTRSRCATK